MLKLKKRLGGMSLILSFVITISASVMIFAEGSEGASETAPEKINSAKPVVLNTIKKDVEGLPAHRTIGEEDSLVCENNNFSLYLNKEKLIVKVVDKANNYVWSSGIDTDDVEELSDDWKSFSQALVVAEYMDKYAPTTLIRAYPVPQEIRYTDNGFITKVLFEKPKITADVSVTLNDDGISVEVLDESIKSLQKANRIKFSLSKLYVMPFLGAVQSGEADGYLFVPDGSGALIRFTGTKKYSVAYSSRVYGKDYGITRDVDLTESTVPTVKGEKAHIPVFGVSHGNKDNAFVAIIENGQEYSDIEGYPAGVKVDYFWAAAKFNYMEAYFQPSGSGLGFSQLPKKPNSVNAKVTYKFLNGQEADYVGMAEKYKKVLIERGDLVKHTENGGNVPLLIEAFMAEQRKGLFTNVTKPMTTLSDLSGWVKELGAESISNLLVALKGYQKGGVSGSNVGSYKVESKIGSEKELEDLYKQLNAQNSNLLLSMDYSKAYENQSRNSNYVYNIDHAPAHLYEEKLLYSKQIFMNTKTILGIMTSTNKLPDYKKNILLQSTGNTLLSDHRSNKEETRSEALKKINQALESAYNNLDKLAIDSPNEYAFKYSDYAVNMPDTHSQFIYESDAVPFLQIVLSGYVDSFAPHLNFGTQQIEDVLKLIDYNMYPSYLITEKPSAEFEDTNVNDIYFSEYESLKPYLVRNYKLVNEVLSQVRGLGITGREIVEDGISVNTYEDGTKVVVNYTDSSYTYEDNLVKAKSAIVIKR